MASSIFLDFGGSSGTLPTPYGVGDLLVASGSSTLATLPDVASGSVLASGGVAASPAYSATPTLTDLTLTGLLRASAGTGVAGVTESDGVNGPEFRVYHYKTGADSEFLKIRWATGGIPPFQILTDQTGTGTATGLIMGTVGDMPVDIGVNNAYRWTFQHSAGNYALHSALDTGQDYGYDMGGSAGRIATVYAAFGLTGSRRLTANTAGRDMTIRAESAASGATNKAGGALYLDAGFGTGNATPGLVIIRTATATASGTADTSLAERLKFDGSNNAIFLANIAFNANANISVGSATVVAQAMYSRILSSDSGNSLFLRAPGSASVVLGANGTDWWNVNLAGTFYPSADATNQIGTSSNRVTSLFTSAGVFAQGANGQFLQTHKQLTELTTIAAAATTDTTILLPANAVIYGVAVRTTTTIPTATSYSVGDAGSATRFSTANVGVASGSVDAGTKAGAYYNATATAVRLTMNGGTPANNSGRVRVTIFYYEITPPTS